MQENFLWYSEVSSNGSDDVSHIRTQEHPSGNFNYGFVTRANTAFWCSFGEITIHLTVKMSNILYLNDTAISICIGGMSQLRINWGWIQVYIYIYSRKLPGNTPDVAATWFEQEVTRQHLQETFLLSPSGMGRCKGNLTKLFNKIGRVSGKYLALTLATKQSWPQTSTYFSGLFNVFILYLKLFLIYSQMPKYHFSVTLNICKFARIFSVVLVFRRNGYDDVSHIRMVALPYFLSELRYFYQFLRIFFCILF